MLNRKKNKGEKMQETQILIKKRRSRRLWQGEQ